MIKFLGGFIVGLIVTGIYATIYEANIESGRPFPIGMFSNISVHQCKAVE